MKECGSLTNTIRGMGEERKEGRKEIVTVG
jgi:hypothetical protein